MPGATAAISPAWSPSSWSARTRSTPSRARSRSSAQQPAPGEARHQGARPEGPRLGRVASHDLIDQTPDLGRVNADVVARLVGEAAPRRAAAAHRCEIGADEDPK